MTGHTLYNNSSIVIRELIQNSIDAVRLQAIIDGTSSESHGKIKVKWDSGRGVLEITDNGTGMTQAIIEDHLLKVGSSRYQDAKFKEQFQSFSPISRFGIGVLSAFMVADSVEILTSAVDEDKARRISLRSVHGRYLIRLVDKQSEEIATAIGLHGTRFRLTFRASAERIDVLGAVQQFVYFPRCSVEVVIDGSAPRKVGYGSPRNALEEYLKTAKIGASWLQKTKVEEEVLGGVMLAYALRYDSHYGDWNLISGFGSPSGAFLDRRRRLEDPWVPIGTCVEGIAVEFGTPGFSDRSFLAVVNYTGLQAPKTNVARSLIENTRERADAISAVYALYAKYIRDEVGRLQKEEKYSLTYATEQIPYLSGALRHRPNDVDEGVRALLDELPMFLVEDGEVRTARTAKEIGSGCGRFAVAESQLLKSIEELIKQAPGDMIARTMFAQSNSGEGVLPAGPILVNTFSNNLVREW